MEQKLFTELRPLYVTSRENPNAIRIRIRLCDPIDPVVLRHAADTTMKRYPYFCVELQKKNGQYVFSENHRPVVVTDSLQGVELNSAESNFHMIAFSQSDNRIILDVFHGMTDGVGAYEILRTLLYYYCSEHYHVKLKAEGIRLLGDKIPAEEWYDPVAARTDFPSPLRNEMSDALNLITSAGLQNDKQHTVYSLAVSEEEFMKFNNEYDGTPGTMVSLLFGRAISKLFPESKDIIRIALCVNQRNALHAPLAHQSLVGGAFLEYRDELRDLSLDQQVRVFREMVFSQTREDVVLEGVASQYGISRLLLSKDSDQERIGSAAVINSRAERVITLSVSYVGKADLKEAERYIRDFRLWTSPASNGMTIEISAVNGRFTLDFIQVFSSPVFVNAFLQELEDHGIRYDLQDVKKLELPNINLPWTVRKNYE